MPATTTDVSVSPNGEVADVGTWGVPGQRRKGKVGSQALELNATAAGQHEHPGEFRVLQRCSTPSVARARAAKLRRKLRENQPGILNGLDYPKHRFEIKTEGALIWARYNPVNS